MFFRKKDPQVLSQKEKRNTLIFLAIFLLSALGLTVWRYHWPSMHVQLAGQELDVLVAKTPWHWHRGLGKRENLGRYDGMLFLFPLHGRTGIVMRDMQFPLDIVWIDNGEVVDIAPNVPVENVPEDQLTVYKPRKDNNMVLELPAGWANEHGLKIGDRMRVVE